MICSRCNKVGERLYPVQDGKTGVIQMLCAVCYAETATTPPAMTKIEKKLAMQNIKKSGVRKTNIFQRMRGII